MLIELIDNHTYTEEEYIQLVKQGIHELKNRIVHEGDTLTYVSDYTLQEKYVSLYRSIYDDNEPIILYELTSLAIIIAAGKLKDGNLLLYGIGLKDKDQLLEMNKVKYNEFMNGLITANHHLK